MRIQDLSKHWEEEKNDKRPDPARNTLTNSELDNFNREYPTKWELFWGKLGRNEILNTESPRRQGAIFVSSLPFRNSKASPFEKQMLTRAKPSWKAHKCKLKFLEIAREWEGWSMEKWKPTSLRTAPGWAKLQYLKVNAVLQNLLFFLLKLTIHSGAVCCPIAMSHSPNKPSVPALVPPPKFSVTKNWNILAFPDFSCSSAVWVMLWTTLASRTCQRIHKKRLKQIPSVLLYYPLPSNIAVATKVEHVDTPYHCFLMPQERLKISGVTKPTVPAVKIPILSYTSKSNITAQKSKNED